MDVLESLKRQSKVESKPWLGLPQLSILKRIEQHVTNPESQHRRIASGFLWVSLFVLLSKLASAAKEMAVAWRYGVSETVDAYAFLLNLVSWPTSVWFGVLTVVLVPLVARLRNDDPEELTRFRSELLGLALLVGLTLTLLTLFGLPALLRARWLGLSNTAVAEAFRMLGGIAWLPTIGFSISLFSAWMLACGRHRNTLFEAIPALVILVALLLPTGWISEPLLWGTVAGSAFHLVALAGPLRQRGELNPPRLSFKSPEWRGFWNSVGIMSAGQVLMSFTSMIDQFFAAGLGPGALSTLSYSNRVVALLLGIVAMAIGRATLPIFSEVHSEKGADVTALALRWAKWMSLFGVVVGVLAIVLASSVVRVLFERGAFTASHTDQVAAICRYALVQVPFYTFSVTLANLMASQRRYRVLLLSGIVGLGMKILTSSLLVTAMGVSGLVLSASAVYFSNAALFLYFASRSRQ